MNREKLFGIDHKKQWVFIFLLENNDKKLSLFIEYTNEENLELAKQDLALYGMFWDTGSIVESIINSFDINPSKKLGLKTWYEQVLKNLSRGNHG